MIHITPIKRQILGVLSHHPNEHLSMYYIAAELDEPVFRVRAELIDLGRHRLVRQQTSRGLGLIWELTPIGESILFGEQLELDA